MLYRIHTDLSHGNAADVRIDECTSPPTVEFTPHPHGGPEALWFCFRIERTGTAAPDELRLLLKHYASVAYTHRDCTDALRPVLRSTATDWQRLDAPQRSELTDGRIQVSWIVRWPGQASWIEVAFCYPHGEEQVKALVAESGGYWRGEAIGVSAGGRPMIRLSNGCGESAAKPPGLYLLAQQHAGEMPGGWVLDGLLRGLGEQKPPRLVAWCVPLANIDGVKQGDYGKDNFPYDLNRAWGTPAMRHETLVLQQDMRLWAQRCTPRLALDFHAPGPCETAGVYCYPPDPDTAPKRAAAAQPWIELFREALGEYAAGDFARVVHYRSRWETRDFCDFAGLELGCPALAFETPYALAGEGRLLLERSPYGEIGRRLAGAIASRLAGD